MASGFHRMSFPTWHPYPEVTGQRVIEDLIFWPATPGVKVQLYQWRLGLGQGFLTVLIWNLISTTKAGKIG